MAKFKCKVCGEVFEADSLEEAVCPRCIKNEKGIVVEKIDNMNGTGRISINGEEFVARTANGLPVAEGNTVTVVDHDGRIMLVL